jgi:hypothetical protein
MDAFMQALGSAINNTISNLSARAETHYQHLPLETPSDPISDDIPDKKDFFGELGICDLKRLLFPRLTARARGNLTLLAIIRAWEQDFMDAERIPDPLNQRKSVFHVRRMAREILRALDA